MKATTTTLEDGAPSLRRSADFVARHPVLTPGPSPDCAGEGENGGLVAPPHGKHERPPRALSLSKGRCPLHDDQARVHASTSSARTVLSVGRRTIIGFRSIGVTSAIVIALLGLFAVVAVRPGIARADGEAGVVIQHGDGSTETFCVAFTGESISGDQLLKRAGVAQENVNGLVCSVGQRAEEGCYGAGTFESCTCKCKNSGAGCAYWAFYTQRYGQQWIYSALGFLAQRAKDGDMQAWRWGLGSANSAPPPVAISFEQVCGHSPRGGIAPATNTALPPTIVAATTTPNTVAPATIAAATVAASSPVVTITATANASATSPGEPRTTTASTASPDSTPTFVLPKSGPGKPPSAVQQEGGGSGRTGVLAFAVLAGALVTMIAGAIAWRKRRGR